ncbi:MAG: hypothetical protein FWC57_06850, partial [Endomicrobia bacterium]|nr:hypothetical protein [Endomicrobiia bacterium]
EKYLISRQNNPEARLKEAHKISKYLTSMTDASDGLFISLKLLAKESKKGADIFIEDIPMSRQLKRVCGTGVIPKGLCSGSAVCSKSDLKADSGKIRIGRSHLAPAARHVRLIRRTAAGMTAKDVAFDFALCGAEDFELVFTVPPSEAKFLKKMVPDISYIGKINNSKKVRYFYNGKEQKTVYDGYKHF